MERAARTFWVQLPASGGWAGFRLAEGANRFQVIVPVNVGGDVSLRFRWGSATNKVSNTDPVLTIPAGGVSPILLAPSPDVYIELGGNAQIPAVDYARVWVNATEV